MRVGTVDIGGMQREEAGELIARKLAGTTGEPVAVLFNDTHYVLRAKIAKARINIDATLDAALDAGDDKAVTPRVTYARTAVQDFAARSPSASIIRPARPTSRGATASSIAPARARASRSTRPRSSPASRASWPRRPRSAGSRSRCG